jgi:hypothetical protein
MNVEKALRQLHTRLDIERNIKKQNNSVGVHI